MSSTAAMNLALKVAIVESGRTQRELSFDARVAETRLSAIVRGHVTPTPNERAALAKALGRQESELFLEAA